MKLHCETAVALVIAMLGTTGVALAEGWSKQRTLQQGSYFPPVANGQNPNHSCDQSSGVCLQDGNTCVQEWTDTDGNGPSAGDNVRCHNLGVAW